MIWTSGKILPDEGLTINANDRTFEHGLGLFETFRTYNGRATLLEQHKARLLRSASELKLPIDPASLPDASAVRALLEAEDLEGDRILRITASGGTALTNSVVWMKTAPLPEPIGDAGASLLLNSWEVVPKDQLAHHKTLNYWARRRAFEEARCQGFDEALSGTLGRHDDYHYEGSRTNVFLVFPDGLSLNPFKKKRPELYTSSTAAPIVPGIMRQTVIEIARELSFDVKENDLGIDATWPGLHCEVFLTNSVRGISPVGRVTNAVNRREYHLKVPGPVTCRLQESLANRLWPNLS
jgi:branched-subunit amino acid aminotransferase/4-amino-4-deoxychorismate lyase